LDEKINRAENSRINQIKFEGSNLPPGTIIFDGSQDLFLAAVACEEGVFYSCEVEARKNLQEKLFSTLFELLESAGFKRPHQQPLLAVGCGPGSYTSVRVSVAAGRAMAQAAGSPVLILDSLEIVARSYWLLNSCALGKVAIVRDAKMNQVYLAGYELDSDIKKIHPVQIFGIEEAKRFLRENHYLTVISDTFSVYSFFKDLNFLEVRPRAIGLISTALEKYKEGTLSTWEKLLPVYLRVSYAEMKYDANQG
jgi:tRNA threonylcarbamoyladenosine biosynthesis protein TsaB